MVANVHNIHLYYSCTCFCPFCGHVAAPTCPLLLVKITLIASGKATLLLCIPSKLIMYYKVALATCVCQKCPPSFVQLSATEAPGQLLLNKYCIVSLEQQNTHIVLPACIFFFVYILIYAPSVGIICMPPILGRVRWPSIPHMQDPRILH